MTIDERRSLILKKIETQGSVLVKDIVSTFQVSDMTIRRDLDELEKTNLIRRKHGKAISVRGTSFEPPYQMRKLEHSAEKARIGIAAAGLVEPGDSIAFDTGSTSFQAASNLLNLSNLTIVTHSLTIVDLFRNSTSNAEIIVLGGKLRKEENSLVGDIALSTLKDFFLDKLFLCAGGISCHAGLTEFNSDDAIIKKTLIPHAHQVILLADSSKFNKTAFHKFGDLSSISMLVTDKMPPKDLLTMLQESKVDILIAK